MQHYIDITLLPNDDIGHYFLWSKLYQQLHLLLVNKGETGVGFSFPEYSKNHPRLGRKLRVFGASEAVFQQLDLAKCLNRLADYCHISSLRTVPENAQYAIFSRKQAVTNNERLARRRAKRKGETFEQALTHFEGFVDEHFTLPFVELDSSSTAKEGETRRFKLFIDQKMVTSSQAGKFTSYGLSKTATVPWF